MEILQGLQNFLETFRFYDIMLCKGERLLFVITICFKSTMELKAYIRRVKHVYLETRIFVSVPVGYTEGSVPHSLFLSRILTQWLV